MSFWIFSCSQSKIFELIYTKKFVMLLIVMKQIRPLISVKLLFYHLYFPFDHGWWNNSFRMKWLACVCMHGLCGIAFTNAKCMIEGKCSKRFPKSSGQVTILSNEKYPLYRPKNDSKSIFKNIIDLDNQWVVPHILYLTTKYNAHINIDTIGAIKYLYKYVYKVLLLVTSLNII